jgi:hypothetical protein
MWRHDIVWRDCGQPAPMAEELAPPKAKKDREGGEKVKKEKKKEKYNDGEPVSKKARPVEDMPSIRVTPSPPTPAVSSLPHPPLMITQRQVSEAGEITPAAAGTEALNMPTSPIAIPRFSRPSVPYVNVFVLSIYVFVSWV